MASSKLRTGSTGVGAPLGSERLQLLHVIRLYRGRDYNVASARWVHAMLQSALIHDLVPGPLDPYHELLGAHAAVPRLCRRSIDCGFYSVV